MQRREAVLGHALAQHLRDLHGVRESLQGDRADIAIFEPVADEAAGERRDHDAIGWSQSLQPGRHVGRFAHGAPLALTALSCKLADHCQPRGDAAARPQLAVPTLELRDRLGDLETGANGALRIILAGLRISKVGKDPISQVLGDEARMPLEDFAHAAVIPVQQFAQVFGVERRCELRHTDKIAEHDRQLAPFQVIFAEPGNRDWSARPGLVGRLLQPRAALAAKLGRGGIDGVALLALPGHSPSKPQALALPAESAASLPIQF